LVSLAKGGAAEANMTTTTRVAMNQRPQEVRFFMVSSLSILLNDFKQTFLFGRVVLIVL
jgi:hypothetical protein